jgi:asparagine synthase (glutamine-hydrolysing)
MLDRMIACMIHEPSHVSGKHVDTTIGLSVGWVGHDQPSSHAMTCWNADRNVALVSWGQDFFAHASDSGYRHGDPVAHRLLALYERSGIAFIGMLNSWFCGLLVDLRTATIVLFNDRYGLQRIYWHESGGCFYFSSEAKCLLTALPHLRVLDTRSAAEFHSFGAVLQNRTLFAGLSLLPPASRWSFLRNGTIVKDRYFAPQQWEEQSPLDPVSFCNALKATFAAILPRYLRADVPAGMSLTGGLDGRMIMAWAKLRDGELPCYTFAGAYRDSADVRIAREIAALCRQPHHTLVVDDAVVAAFPTLAEQAVHVSDGTMDVSGSIELHVNRVARAISPIRITGNYGSEIIRRHVAFKPRAVDTSLLVPEFAEQVRLASETYRLENSCHPLTFIAFKQVPWHHYARLSLEQSVLTVRSPYLDNDLVSLMYRAPTPLCYSRQPSLDLIFSGNPKLASVPTDRGIRYPQRSFGTLCHLAREFSVRCEYAYDYGMPQWLANIDRLLTPFGPHRLFLGRHKFYHFRIWYRDKLASFVHDALLGPRARQRSYFTPRALQALVEAHVSGRRNYTSEIHMALTMEFIHRQFVEQ